MRSRWAGVSSESEGTAPAVMSQRNAKGERSGPAFVGPPGVYGGIMLTLQGRYHVAPNKRLTILAEAGQQPKGTLETDIQALREACAQNAGRCEVEVTTQHGTMRGTLIEKKARKLSLRLFEGHLAFLPRA